MSNNYIDLIREYNNKTSFPDQIERMEDINLFLDEYGYEPEEDIYELYEIIDVRDFDINDEYFWVGKNGYLYSGNAEDAYLAKISGTNYIVENTETLYRYTIEIDGQRYGFITGIDKLIEKEVIDEDNPLLRKINVLFSDMQVPNWHTYDADKRCYFTEKGLARFGKVVDEYAKELEKLGYKVILDTKVVNLDNIEYVDDDEYQVIARLHRLIKKAEIEIPSILYHATFNAYLDSIMQEGLIPGKHSNYDGMVNSDCVYLATDEDVAESYCEAADLVDDEIYDSGITVLQIDTLQLDKSKFVKDENVIDDEDIATIAYRGIIPPSAIN